MITFPKVTRRSNERHNKLHLHPNVMRLVFNGVKRD